MRILKTILALLLGVTILLPISKVQASESQTTKQALISNHSVKSAYLIESSTGTELFSMKETEACEIASVTKVMTLLLVMEALENEEFKLDDVICISKNAASMGGSQVFLEEGEMITVEELIKCAVIASANDASVALAELVSGSEGVFVNKMNQKAKQLNLVNTYFENKTWPGLIETARFEDENFVFLWVCIIVLSVLISLVKVLGFV